MQTQDEVYDIAIVGSGPAGLEAALTARLRDKSIILFDSGESFLPRAHQIDNYLGLPAISGAQLWQQMREHADRENISVTKEKITEIAPQDSLFHLFTKDNFYQARSVILAMGRSFTTPYPEEETLVGQGIHYCVTCDARAYKGKRVGVIGDAASIEDEVVFLTQIAESVVFFPQYQDAFVKRSVPSNLEIIPETVRDLEAKNERITVKTEQTAIDVAGLFILRSLAPAWQMIAGLQMDHNFVVVDRGLRTNIPGVFAAGDVTGPPFQLMKSAGDGNVAALAAVAYLDEQRTVSG